MPKCSTFVALNDMEPIMDRANPDADAQLTVVIHDKLSDIGGDFDDGAAIVFGLVRQDNIKLLTSIRLKEIQQPAV